MSELFRFSARFIDDPIYPYYQWDLIKCGPSSTVVNTDLEMPSPAYWKDCIGKDALLKNFKSNTVCSSNMETVKLSEIRERLVE